MNNIREIAPEQETMTNWSLERIEGDHTQATPENIQKYFNLLVELHTTLKYTNRLSMFQFSTKNNVTKSLSTVLQNGGVIKCLKKGRNSEWEWTTIKPNRHMAIKTLQELADINPPRKNHVRNDNVRPPKSRPVKMFTVKVFFGLITLKIYPVF